DVRVLAGRGFVATDALPGATAVVVDQTFANELAPGVNVVGRHIRFANRGRDGAVQLGPWLEIVGVVPAFADTFTATTGFGAPWPRVYQAAALGFTPPAALVVRVRGGDPARYAQRFREITASVDPTLKLDELKTVMEWWNHETQFSAMMA